MPAVLEIDRGRMARQAGIVNRDAAVMAVVKNDAYNTGLPLAWRTFREAGIRAFATTSLREAVALRELDEHCSVFLMNPVTEFDVLRENRIDMTLPSLPFYERYKQLLGGIGLHLEYRNLLRRSGFTDADEMEKVLHEGIVQVTGIWTHFAFADEFGLNEYHQEKEAWLGVLGRLSGHLRNIPFIHAQNSASYMRDGLLPGHSHIRPGILLYGARPYPELGESAVPNILTLRAEVIQTIRLRKGESSGYSAAFTADEDCTLAVCDIGYGDGLLRTRARHDVLINGKRYPIAALMMSHLLVRADEGVRAGHRVYLYSDELRVDHYTALGVGANSEQMSALNRMTLDTMIKE
ncbi:alanine racemase [Edaphobacillus lindanitolerans]|uniref:Alanine racemase n=1 Tax=Edaphobacillus lindanitolerans TaxID=550447 RepID=A0A1U7PJA7_9BACI|nr:alanine racemase [Edaphobacillus lindanitolerans]SIT80997.1 alanine racemase [Edaphobacillus lindanitolerans]